MDHLNLYLTWDTGIALLNELFEDIIIPAAVMGHAPSQWNLACLYLNGDGIEQSRELGIQWATKAAKQNYGLAIEGLGKVV